MDNSEIFRLLIIILLITNGSNAESGQTGSLTNINQLILALLLINPPKNDENISQNQTSNFCQQNCSTFQDE